MKSKTLIIYCDGACIDNPGKSGSGVVIYENEDKKPTLLYGDYIENGTNNKAELKALLKALSIAKDINRDKTIIYCDSKYSIGCVTNWAYNWKAKSWKKAGGPIKNLELVKKAHGIYDDLKDRLEIKYVRAHAGNDGNELADKMALYAIKTKSIRYKKYNI